MKGAINNGSLARIQIGVATSLIVLSIGTGTAFKSKQAKYDADLNKAQVALNQKETALHNSK